LTDKGYFKTAGLLLMAIPLVLPVGTAANATDSTTPKADTELVELRSFTSEIVSVAGRTLDLPKVKKDEPKPKVTKPVATLIVSGSYTPDPGAAVKRAWAKRAAAKYSIDWKILEAVWQVESGKSWHRAVRSWAGATGPCQFMPGTWRGYASDGNGDGIKDVTYAPDCLFAAAKLLASNGLAQGNVTQALLRYNYSMSYVNHVLSIARTY
jgi:membrane-bound lytic murein transglycosylase B